MKKNKSEGLTCSRFNNNPFKSLKGMQPGIRPVSSKEIKKAPEETGEDDLELFIRAVSGAREINPDAEGPGEATQNQVVSLPKERDEGSLFLQAMQKIGTRFKHSDDEMESEAARQQSTSSRMRQVKRGTIRIREELDLHGYGRDEALKKLENFIGGAYARGHRAVLVITGKGMNSAEGPVLQGAVAEWLRGNGKGVVAEFSPAPRDRGGSGAFVVFLRSRGER